jgi:hypothetical protein
MCSACNAEIEEMERAWAWDEEQEIERSRYISPDPAHAWPSPKEILRRLGFSAALTFVASVFVYIGWSFGGAVIEWIRAGGWQ